MQRRLSFRNPHFSHHFVDALSSSKERRVVAGRIAAVAADGEGGIDEKPVLRSDARLIETAKPRQGDREIHMRGVEIPVDLVRMAQVRDGFFILPKKDAGDTQIGPPEMGESVARAEPAARL